MPDSPTACRGNARLQRRQTTTTPRSTPVTPKIFKGTGVPLSEMNPLMSPDKPLRKLCRFLVEFTKPVAVVEP